MYFFRSLRPTKIIDSDEEDIDGSQINKTAAITKRLQFSGIYFNNHLYFLLLFLYLSLSYKSPISMRLRLLAKDLSYCTFIRQLLVSHDLSNRACYFLILDVGKT